MNTPSAIFLILFLLACEIVALGFFWLIKMYQNCSKKEIVNSILKGILERGFLLVVLLLDIEVILIFFGAIKIGTRLHNDSKSKVSNDQFLVGNIISVFLAIIYSVAWNYFLC